MPGNPKGTERFESGGKVYTAVFGFLAMEEVERYFDLPFVQAIIKAMPTATLSGMEDPEVLRAAAANTRFSDIGALFRASLLKHHPDLTSADVADLIDDIGLAEVGRIVGQTISAAMVQEGDAGSPENPRKASRKGKTG